MSEQEEIDIKDIKQVLHVLRNPHGWDDHIVRNARLVAADIIEQQAAELKLFRQFAQTVHVRHGEYVMRQYGLLGKNGQPTALLTGKRK